MRITRNILLTLAAFETVLYTFLLTYFTELWLVNSLFISAILVALMTRIIARKLNVEL